MISLKEKFMIVLASLFAITLLSLMITSIIICENLIKEVKEKADKYDLMIMNIEIQDK